MAETVLIPFDGSEQSVRALEYALDLFEDARFVALSVINPAESVYVAGDEGISPFPDNWYESAHEQTRSMQETAVEQAEAAGREMETAVEVGRPGRTIVQYVKDHDVDHVVMGSHGRSGVARFLLGSVAESVIRHSPVPVTVIR